MRADYRKCWSFEKPDFLKGHHQIVQIPARLIEKLKDLQSKESKNPGYPITSILSGAWSS